MTYREILPHPALRRHVDRFWIRSGTERIEGGAHRILPDGRLDVILTLGDRPRANVAKTFGRIARLQRALVRLQSAPREALAAQAVALGYFDQAHMARDFRELCGVAPNVVARGRGSIFPMPPPFDAA